LTAKFFSTPQRRPNQPKKPRCLSTTAASELPSIPKLLLNHPAFEAFALRARQQTNLQACPQRLMGCFKTEISEALLLTSV